MAPRNISKVLRKNGPVVVENPGAGRTQLWETTWVGLGDKPICRIPVCPKTGQTGLSMTAFSTNQYTSSTPNPL